MELWIRSQDKTLLRKPEQLGVVDGDGYWCISENILIDYGHYATKERALEVLDEIYTRLDNMANPKILGEITDVSKQIFIPPVITYEMPKE